MIKTSSLFEELFCLPITEKTNTDYVESDYKQEYFTNKDGNVQNYKMYILAYKQYAKENGYNLKNLNIHFVAPLVEKSAYEAAYVLNNGFKTIAGVNIIINIYTLETFLARLYSLISNNKWYVKKAIPFNCVSKANVDSLVKDGKAIIIN